MLKRRVFLRGIAADPLRVFQILGCAIQRETVKLIVPAHGGYPRILIRQTARGIAGSDPVNDRRNVRAVSGPVDTDCGPAICVRGPLCRVVLTAERMLEVELSPMHYRGLVVDHVVPASRRKRTGKLPAARHIAPAGTERIHAAVQQPGRTGTG